jgi:hypothetical protein
MIWKAQPASILFTAILYCYAAGAQNAPAAWTLPDDLRLIPG